MSAPVRGGAAFVRLGRAFFERPTRVVARDLIGRVLVHDDGHERTAGRIVEVEAYLGRADEASHSFRGRTARNAAMFGPPGHAYVYLCYGVHRCFNVVTAPEGVGEAVLVRALEPLEGLDVMSARRGVERARELCRGPGRLTQALGIGLGHDGMDLVSGRLGLFTAHGVAPRPRVVAGPRIGITRSVGLALRFCAADSPWVSA